MIAHEVNGVVVTVWGAALDADRLTQLLHVRPELVQAYPTRIESEVDLDGSVFEEEIEAAWSYNTFRVVDSRDIRVHVQHIVNELSALPRACTAAQATGRRLDIEFVGGRGDTLPDFDLLQDLIGAALRADLKRLGLDQSLAYGLHPRRSNDDGAETSH